MGLQQRHVFYQWGVRDIFVETGATVEISGGANTVYVQSGGTLIVNGGIHTIYYVNIGDLILNSGINTLNLCPSITFDLTNAPPGGCALLPVELIAFSGLWKNGQIHLRWSTATESNNKGFFVLRSLDGEQWGRLGWVQGKGTTFGFTKYELIDSNPISNFHYYKLRQEDNNENFSFSSVILVEGEVPEKSIQLILDPISKNLSVKGEMTGDSYDIWIFSTDGRLVFRSVVKDNSLNLSFLSPGIYFVRLMNAPGFRTKKITIH